MGGLNDTTTAVAGNAIMTLTIVGWATSTQGKPLSLRLTRQEPAAVVPVREWRGEVLPDGPPPRPQSSLPAPGTNELVVTVAEQLGSGRCGSVFAVDTLRLTDPNNPKTRLLYPQPPHLPELVIKVADAEHEESLKHEAAIYNEMEPLQGVSIPRAYGFFTADLDADTVVPSLSSDVATPRRLSIVVLERLGEMLPLGQKLPEEGDLWDVFRDLARLGIEQTDIRYSNILERRRQGTASRASARKTDLTLKRHYYNTLGYLGPILESMKNNIVLEPWDIKGSTGMRPSAL